ncbi:hypothetical protein E7Y35_02185 [Spiroplasma sp. SV19]|nr:hypothetical protein E7Y35_02185 [Spiroplasma sp. SV19]
MQKENFNALGTNLIMKHQKYEQLNSLFTTGKPAGNYMSKGVIKRIKQKYDIYPSFYKIKRKIKSKSSNDQPIFVHNYELNQLNHNFKIY